MRRPQPRTRRSRRAARTGLDNFHRNPSVAAKSMAAEYTVVFTKTSLQRRLPRVGLLALGLALVCLASWITFQSAQARVIENRTPPFWWGGDSVFVVMSGPARELRSHLSLVVHPNGTEASTVQASILIKGDASGNGASLLWGGYLTEEIHDCIHATGGVSVGAHVQPADRGVPRDQQALWNHAKQPGTLQSLRSVPLRVNYDRGQGMTFFTVECEISDRALWDSPGNMQQLTIPSGEILHGGGGQITATAQSDVYLGPALSYVRGGVNPPKLEDFGLIFATTSSSSPSPDQRYDAQGNRIFSSTWSHFFGFSAYFQDEARQERKELLYLLLGLLLGVGLQLAGLMVSAILDMETPLSPGQLRRTAKDAARTHNRSG